MDKGEIWFICKDAAPLSESGIFFRTLKQAQYFQSKGYSVKIICSDWVHNTSIQHKSDTFWKTEIHDDVEYLFLKSLYYGNSSFRRLISYLLFSFKINKLLKVFVKPDVIIHTSRIPFDSYVFSFAKKCHAKYIMDVSDLWPWELEHNNVLNHNNILLKLFYKVERYLYAKADHVVFSIEGGQDYIYGHKWDRQVNNGPIDMEKVHYVNTGLDYNEFSWRLLTNKFDDKDLLDNNTFKIVYLGSIRPANDLGQLIEAAKHLRNYPLIKILIYGNGPDRDALEKIVAEEQLTNVIFKDKWVDPNYVPFILSQASLNLLNYMKGWAPYGGSMNKLFMAIASGKPILCNAGMGYSPISKLSLGIDKSFSTSEEYAKSILYFYEMDTKAYNQICDNCKKAAKVFDCYKLAQDFANYCNL